MPIYEELNNNSSMPYGANAGSKMEDVPANYLLWMWNDGLCKATEENSKRGTVARYIKEHINVLESECPDTIVKPIGG